MKMKIKTTASSMKPKVIMPKVGAGMKMGMPKMKMGMTMKMGKTKKAKY